MVLQRQRRLGIGRFAVRTSAGLVGVLGAGVVFAVLLALVRTAWAPLDSLDRAVASRMNELVAGNDLMVESLQVVTGLGGRNGLGLLLVSGTGYLLLRRQRRLAAYVLLTTFGALILDPVVKLLVERLRPVVEVTIATAPGPSFPSGHALDSLVAYGVMLLVFLPTIPRRRRGVVIATVATVVALIGVSRVLLGVHYLSDVLGGWALGIAWLGVTMVAFRHWRSDTGLAATPMPDGLAPEAAGALSATGRRHHAPARLLSTATRLFVAAVFIVGLLFGLGYLVSTVARGTAFAAADLGVVQWLEAHRTETWTMVLARLNRAGDTGWIVTVTVAAGGLALGFYRRWRPVLFLWTVMVGEVLLFVIVSTVVTRSRPPVSHLQPHLPPTASFPSGHVAGAICLYAGIALLVWHTTRSPALRAISATLAVLMPAGVASARLYRGVHHPTDVAGSVLLAALWLTVAWIVIKPLQATGDADNQALRATGDADNQPLPAAGDADSRPLPAVEQSENGLPPAAERSLPAVASRGSGVS
jgi:undecaprenyl-diphosphatase